MVEAETSYQDDPHDACCSPFAEITSCSHGLPESEDLRLRNTAISGYITRLSELYEGLAEQSCTEKVMLDEGIKLYTVYWKLHSHLVDELLVKAVFAAAADAILNDMFVEARTLTHLGINFEGTVYGRSERQATDMKKTVTDRGLKIYLANKIPCNCMSGLKKAAKRAPKMNLCFHCQKEDVRDNIRKCSRCKVARYCSKECQKADWASSHKDQCQMISDFYVSLSN